MLVSQPPTWPPVHARTPGTRSPRCSGVRTPAPLASHDGRCIPIHEYLPILNIYRCSWTATGLLCDARPDVGSIITAGSTVHDAQHHVQLIQSNSFMGPWGRGICLCNGGPNRICRAVGNGAGVADGSGHRLATHQRQHTPADNDGLRICLSRRRLLTLPCVPEDLVAGQVRSPCWRSARFPELELYQ